MPDKSFREDIVRKAIEQAPEDACRMIREWGIKSSSRIIALNAWAVRSPERALAFCQELIAFIRLLPPDARRAAFEVSSTLPDKETERVDLLSAFPDGVDRDLVLLATAGVADVSNAMKFAEQISEPSIRSEAYLRISASNPTEAAKNASLMSRLEPLLAEFYKRYPNEGGSSGFAQFFSLGLKPERKKYRDPDF